MKYPSITLGRVEAVLNILGGEQGVDRLLRGELVVQPAVIPLPEPVLDFIIRVDRSVKPTYPDWVKKLMHPELEQAGPAEYDLQTQVEQWLHDDQKDYSVVGNTIYDRLKKGDNLASCLNLQDGLAIKQKGVAVFRKLFSDKAVFLWGSVVQYRTGYLHVPFIFRLGSRVGLRWHWLGSRFGSSNPALLFK